MHRLRGAYWVPLVRHAHERYSSWHIEHAVMWLAQRLRPLQQVPVAMRDGRVLFLDLRNPCGMPYLTQGDFPCEAPETDFVRRVVRPGDTVIDIGANSGWYTTLLCEQVGSDGRVYAFEPNTRLAALLRRLAPHFPQLQVEAAGLGDCDGKECFSTPENWISGSFGVVSDAVFSEYVPVHRLDTFTELEEIAEITFVKCDAEGAELGILSGAVKTISQQRPPMWMVEMSSEETSNFGYHPQRLVEFFRGNVEAGYEMYMISQESGALEPLVMPEREPFWFNAVFVPRWLDHRIADPIARPHSDPTTTTPTQSADARNSTSERHEQRSG